MRIFRGSFWTWVGFTVAQNTEDSKSSEKAATSSDPVKIEDISQLASLPHIKSIPLYANLLEEEQKPESDGRFSMMGEGFTALPVGLDFQLLSVNGIELGDEVTDIDLVVSTTWYDSRFKDIKPRFGNKVIISSKQIWTPDIYIANQVLDANVKDVADDCEIITDVDCHQGSWHKYVNHRRKRDSNAVDVDKETRHGNKQLCFNVRCIQVMRVMAKFGANPQAFPYDIQFPYLEFKSRAYPLSLVQIHTDSLLAATNGGEFKQTGDLAETTKVGTIKHNLFISNSEWKLNSFKITHKPVKERLADNVQVSTIRVDMEFERNTPKLNLTLYVPILILLALFLGSILIPIASGEKLGFQITLLLSSYIYFDVFQDMLPPFETTGDTPAALIFFIILIIIQFFTIIVSLWEQRLETNGWERSWFQAFVEKLTQGKIKKENFEDEEEFKTEQRECFFDRIDWFCFILTFGVLMVSAGASVISAASNRT